jgi:hypothetical protein
VYFPEPEPSSTVNETFPLWPTKVDIYLSGSNKHPHNHGTSLYIYYNLSHFTELNPQLAPSCDLLPDVSGVPYIRDTESWYQFSVTQPDVNKQCEMLCVVWFQFTLECPMTAGSGTYFIKIPGVGEVEIDMTVCTNEGVDYGVNCDLIPKECQRASPFMVQTAPKTHSGLTKADKVGISFGVVGGAMLVVIIALSVLYFLEKSNKKTWLFLFSDNNTK